jgi:hypothetical protein
MPWERHSVTIWRTLHAPATAGELHRTHLAWPPDVPFLEKEGPGTGCRRFVSEKARSVASTGRADSKKVIDSNITSRRFSGTTHGTESRDVP